MNRNSSAAERQGNMQSIGNICQLEISSEPKVKRISVGMTSQARSDVNKIPTIQNAERIMISRLRYFVEKNLEKETKATGSDPPTPSPLRNRNAKKAKKLGDKEEAKSNSPLITREVMRHAFLPAMSAQLPHT